MVSKYRSNIYPKRDVLPDGTEVRLVPLERTNNHPLYASEDGRVFSLHGKSYYPLRPTVTNYPCNRANGRRKQKYLKMTKTYGYILVHTAVALAWIDDKPSDGYVVDHINGITTDNRATNLQWVTPAENRKRAVILRARRMVAREDGRPELLPENMKPEELLALFNAYNVAGDCYDAMEDDMTHHREC